jgi:hypothetical protein
MQAKLYNRFVERNFYLDTYVKSMSLDSLMEWSVEKIQLNSDFWGVSSTMNQDYHLIYKVRCLNEIQMMLNLHKRRQSLLVARKYNRDYRTQNAV